jgi:hypothetical protein
VVTVPPVTPHVWSCYGEPSLTGSMEVDDDLQSDIVGEGY